MRAHTPQNLEAARKRPSLDGHRDSIRSGIPRVQSRLALARAANTQPTYDLITGLETTNRPPSHDTFRHSQPRRSSTSFRDSAAPIINVEALDKGKRENDELKAEIKTLKYTLDNRKQEEELTTLRWESEVREVRKKAEEDFKGRQTAESERTKAVRLYEASVKEVEQLREESERDRGAFEKRVREVEEREGGWRDEAEELKVTVEERERLAQRRVKEAEGLNETLNWEIERSRAEEERLNHLLQGAEAKGQEKEETVGELEAEVLRLKAQTGDVDTLGVIKRELSEQVAHIRTLEAANREQSIELKHFRRLHKSIEVVEEEKRRLQRKVESIDSLEIELGEARIQRQRLEDERLVWTAFLQSQAGEDGAVEFESPEALARALVEERLHAAMLVERIGALEAESMDKDGLIQGLDAEKKMLAEQVEKLKIADPAKEVPLISESKARLRLERQRALAIKEVEYLRAQLKTFDTEDITFQPEKVDNAKIKRIQELEDIVDKYREEVQTIQNELSTIEKPIPQAATELGTKRPHEVSSSAEESERLGQLTRKNRKLQDSLTTLQSAQALLQKELSITQERLSAATTRNATRILSLRSNPTTEHEAVKQSTLTALQNENADLLAQLQSRPTPTIPISALTACQREIASAQSELASERKRNSRLKSVWLAKSQEFRELIVSLLGWDVVFMPNGKMRVTSWFYPSEGDEENSIVFDGERGTMKVSGGRESRFKERIRGQVEFWVEGRGSIPCFLAALTLEFWEEREGMTMGPV